MWLLHWKAEVIIAATILSNVYLCGRNYPRAIKYWLFQIVSAFLFPYCPARVEESFQFITVIFKLPSWFNSECTDTTGLCFLYLYRSDITLTLNRLTDSQKWNKDWESKTFLSHLWFISHIIDMHLNLQQLRDCWATDSLAGLLLVVDCGWIDGR